MSVPPPEHLHLGERMPGTVWRALRPLLVFLLVVAIGYGLVCAGIAITTADKCGDSGHFNTAKEWNWVPPKWECVTRLPGEG